MTLRAAELGSISFPIEERIKTAEIKNFIARLILAEFMKEQRVSTVFLKEVSLENHLFWKM